MALFIPISSSDATDATVTAAGVNTVAVASASASISAAV